MRALLFLAIFLASTASAHRSESARREFEQSTPCPSTGVTTGKCQDYVIDHKLPLCAGFPDSANNMVWEELRESMVKDQEERAFCAKVKAGKVPATTNPIELCTLFRREHWPLLEVANCPK